MSGYDPAAGEKINAMFQEIYQGSTAGVGNASNFINFDPKTFPNPCAHSLI